MFTPVQHSKKEPVNDVKLFQTTSTARRRRKDVKLFQKDQL